jgi:Fe-S oxidoreductase
MAIEQIVEMDDTFWQRLVELTGGAAALCYQCGACTATCPWGLVRQEALPVRRLLRRAQLGLPEQDPDIWLCATCAQCEAYCPRGVSITGVFRALRTIAWENRDVEKGLPTLLWSLYWNGNPWSQPPSQRSAWARHLEIADFDARQHEILLYTGCTCSYDRRAQKVARALVAVLRAAGVSFGYLGDLEPCCGEAALSVGHTPFFQDIARHTAQTFAEKGVERLVAISPHCYDVFKNHYPRLLGQEAFTAIHYTQLLEQLLDDNRLTFDDHPQTGEATGEANIPTLKIAFQDPCYLGRHNGEYQAPRRLLSAIPGVELVEMKQHSQASLCCGGGGGRMWLETASNERFSDLRISEAAQCGAEILATACPFCLVCLEDSAKTRARKRSNGGQARDEGVINVMDVAEIVAAALDNCLPGSRIGSV